MSGVSSAYRQLARLQPGDQVPPELYILDYADGERPRWQVHEAHDLPSGGRYLTLVDADNGAWDLLDTGERVAVRCLTWQNKTLRSQPFPLGSQPAATLCDLDQQGRRDARGAAA